MMPGTMLYGYLHFWASLLIPDLNKCNNSGKSSVDCTEISVNIQDVSKLYVQASGASVPQQSKGKFHESVRPQTLGFRGKAQKFFDSSSPNSTRQIFVCVS